MWTKYLIYFISTIWALFAGLYLLKIKMKKLTHKESWVVLLFFLTNFTCSFGLYALLLQEIFCFKQTEDYLEVQLWNFVISILNFNIIFMGPFLLIKRITDNFPFQKVRHLAFGVSSLVYFYYLARKLNQEVMSIDSSVSQITLFVFFQNIFSKEAQLNLLGKFCLPLTISQNGSLHHCMFVWLWNHLHSISVLQEDRSKEVLRADQEEQD
jgi:hypothetical protein